MEPVFACAGLSGAVAGASAATPSQPRTATGPATTTSAAVAAAAGNDAGHSAAQLQMYEAAGGRDGRHLDGRGDQGMPSPATPESPAVPASEAAAGAVGGVPPQGGRRAAALPAGWLSRSNQQPPASPMQPGEPPQLSQLPPWMASSQQLVSAHVGCNYFHATSTQHPLHLFLLAQSTMKRQRCRHWQSSPTGRLCCLSAAAAGSAAGLAQAGLRCTLPSQQRQPGRR